MPSPKPGVSKRGYPMATFFCRFDHPDLPTPDYYITLLGSGTQVTLIPLSRVIPARLPSDSALNWYFVLLRCAQPGVELLYCRPGRVLISLSSPNRYSDWDSRMADMVPLAPDTVQDCLPFAEVRTVYISHPDLPHVALYSVAARHRLQLHSTIHLLLRREFLQALQCSHYEVDLRRNALDGATAGTHRLTISWPATEIIVVEYTHALEGVKDDQRLMIEAHISVVRSDEPGIFWKVQIMRVHDTQTGKFCDRKADDPPYAILSHTWDANEQSFQDVRWIQGSVGIRWLLRATCITLGSFLFTYIFLFIFLVLELAKLGVAPEHNSPEAATTYAWFEYLPPSQAPSRFQRVIHVWQQAFQATVYIIFRFPSVLNDPRLSEKIRRACTVARFDQFSQLWVDTSCIDKTSSSELSEAINSMFAWYRDAAVCYVYLADVPRSSDHRRAGSAFRHSRWFTRGWTLQEPIAPWVVVFLSREWELIGTKESLADLVEDITGISRDVLTHKKSHNDVSVAARMSWAAKRTTTRVEDEAYCLLGLFDIVMTPIYGEGRYAFRRLQEEILRHIPDDSIFAWESHTYDLDTRIHQQFTSSAPNRVAMRNMIHDHGGWSSRWLRWMPFCYVHLPDVPPPESEDPRAQGSHFRQNEWFKQCWTLQELVAPRVVIFLSGNWEIIETKENLADLIEEITGIDRDILTHAKGLRDTGHTVSWDF
ncbi:hypothetical protein V8D89_001196 [Ganoderma adspersum]